MIFLSTLPTLRIINDVHEILERLKNFKLYLKLSKYEFSVDRAEFLSFMVITRNIDIEGSRVEVIIN